MECDYRYGTTQEEAFEEAFDLMETAETGGLDGIWLAERHFAAPGRPLDAFGAGIPSIASVPLVLASAIAARTRRVRIGLAVSVLPLCHPIRMAEEAAGTTAAEERLERAERLARVSYDDLLHDRLAYGSPDMVVEKLHSLRDTLDLAGIVIEPNVGGGIPRALVLQSVRLFAQEVAPRLRD